MRSVVRICAVFEKKSFMVVICGAGITLRSARTQSLRCFLKNVIERLLGKMKSRSSMLPRR